MTYERTVAAVVAETKSKFAVAEALATDIPPRRRGPNVGPELTVTEHLTLARVDIIRAGGEVRSVKTLSDYRETALWVSTDLGRNFRWIKGVSFSAHLEARAAGLSYDEFAAMPKKTVDAVRGNAGTDGPPEKIVDSWTPEQKMKAVERLLDEPEVAARAYSRTREMSAEKLREAYERVPEELRNESLGAPTGVSQYLSGIREYLRLIHELATNPRVSWDGYRGAVAEELQRISRQAFGIAEIIADPKQAQVTDEDLERLLRDAR